jgi:hypothetical protein
MNDHHPKDTHVHYEVFVPGGKTHILFSGQGGEDPEAFAEANGGVYDRHNPFQRYEVDVETCRRGAAESRPDTVVWH